MIALAYIDGGPQVPPDALSRPLTRTFDAEVVLAADMQLPPAAWDAARQQYRARTILDALASHKKREWHRLLGITGVDLYAPGLNFVFGEADQQRGIAVVSLARLRYGADLELLHRRAAIEAIHELGHTYGLPHCSHASCVMWFSNTLSESDRKGTEFCDLHSAMLRGARANR